MDETISKTKFKKKKKWGKKWQITSMFFFESKILSNQSTVFCFGLELLDLMIYVCRTIRTPLIISSSQQRCPFETIWLASISNANQCSQKTRYIFWSSLFLNFWPRANIFFLFVLWLHNVPVMGLGFVKDGQSTVDGRAVRESHKRESQRK